MHDNLPEYSPTMHLQGYDAYQVYAAFKKSQRKKLHPKGDQSWVFTGWTDAEAETPILWPPRAKS